MTGTEKIDKNLIQALVDGQRKRMKEFAINGAKDFLSLNEININFDNYIDKLLSAEDYLKACLLLEQDFKEKIELFLDDEYKKPNICQFLYSSRSLEIIDGDEFKIYNDFNDLRVTMAHYIVNKIRIDKSYIDSSSKNWMDLIGNFRKIRFVIYKKLLINFFIKGKAYKTDKKRLENIFNLTADIVWNENIKEIDEALKSKDTIRVRTIIQSGVNFLIKQYLKLG